MILQDMARDALRLMLPARFSRRRRRSWPLSPGFLTPRFPLGAAALIRDAEGRVLLVQQTYQRPASWLPPGGWVDRGEAPEHAARREVREELGVDVAIGAPVAIRVGGYGEVTILFESRLVEDAPFRLSAEIARAEYFSPDALPPMAATTRQSVVEGLAALAC